MASGKAPATATPRALAAPTPTPRRAFDLWNARYFIVPINTNGFDTRERGFASLLPQTELIYPGPAELSARGPGSWR